MITITEYDGAESCVIRSFSIIDVGLNMWSIFAPLPTAGAPCETVASKHTCTFLQSLQGMFENVITVRWCGTAVGLEGIHAPGDDGKRRADRLRPAAATAAHIPNVSGRSLSVDAACPTADQFKNGSAVAVGSRLPNLQLEMSHLGAFDISFSLVSVFGICNLT